MATKTVKEILLGMAEELKRRSSGSLADRFELYLRTQTTIGSPLEQDSWAALGDEVMCHYGEKGLGVRLDKLMDKLSKKTLIKILRRAGRRRSG